MSSLIIVLLNNNNLSGVGPQFNPNVAINYTENPLLIIPKRSPTSTSLLSHSERLAGVKTAALIAPAIVGGLLIAAIAILLSKRLIFKAKDLAV